jgi:hypothetical protein
MEDLINKEIRKIKENIPKIGDKRKEYLFSFVCLQYFYNNGRISFADIRECFVDGRSDGGIDLVLIRK